MSSAHRPRRPISDQPGVIAPRSTSLHPCVCPSPLDEPRPYIVGNLDASGLCCSSVTSPDSGSVSFCSWLEFLAWPWTWFTTCAVGGSQRTLLPASSPVPPCSDPVRWSPISEDTVWVSRSAPCYLGTCCPSLHHDINKKKQKCFLCIPSFYIDICFVFIHCTSEKGTF